jgi:Asp-tRNA(Asn)/Glu-tRNA(Gln) amidotransferase A subunit family amidase
VIRPAAFNGVIGFKPTYGTYDLKGVMPLAPSLDTLGFFTRQIEDVRLIHTILDECAARQVSVDYGGAVPRVGIVRTPWWNRGDSHMHAAFDRTVELLRGEGTPVVDVNMPVDFVDVLTAHETIFSGEAARSFSQELQNHPDQIAPVMRKKLLISGSMVSDAQLAHAREILAKWRSRLDRLMSDIDVLLTPAANGEAPEGLASTGDPLFNRAWTALHVPCICYPVGTGPHGMPLAVQVVGRFGQDEALILHATWMAARSSARVVPAGRPRT